MSTFDRTIIISAPPRTVIPALRRLLTPCVELADEHIFYTQQDGMTHVYYWQPSGRAETYVRYIVTPFQTIQRHLANAPNLIRGLDELEQPIPFEVQDAAYGRIETLKGLGGVAFPALPEKDKSSLSDLVGMVVMNPGCAMLVLMGIGGFLIWLVINLINLLT